MSAPGGFCSGGSALGGVYSGSVCSGGVVCSGGCLLLEGVSAPGGLLCPPPRERWLLLRTVRILLECILVLVYFGVFQCFFFQSDLTWIKSHLA